MIHGFQITGKIHETRHSIIYRALRTADSCPVIVKMLNRQYPTPRGLARYRQEYDIISLLHIPGVIEAYSFEKLGNTVAIVLEDFGASSLNLLWKKQRPTIEQFLEIAIQTTTAIGQIHQQGIIHKDINPSNIVANPHTKQLKLIDFGIATRLSNESPTLDEPNLIEGTLPYVSPEQTGRMNRHLDYRTDFYSLGVTFYELLTGRLPFPKTSPLELVHCHIAAQPRPPLELRQDTPPILSGIVMKLLAKTAEERYQSARGLAADLERCRAQIQSGQSAVDFPLASADISDRFAIPQKLYGRAREAGILLDAFERVGQGHSESVLVTGYSGAGKSSLVRELYKPITERNAFFVSGKFDLLQRATPYSALSATLAGLVEQLLTRSEPELLAWRDAILAALGPNGRILTDVVPELELIIGPQPPVEPCDPIEAQHRVSLVFRSFLRVFCKPTHPLVVFLDDLQWVDSATLRLLKPMMMDDALAHFLLIGAYRDNEVDSSHPLAMTLQSIADEGVTVSEIRVHPLRLDDVMHLLADMLHHATETVRSLAELVIRRTGGNPFFIGEFLKMLHERGLLRFDASLPGRWDMAGIEETPVTENVAELLSPKLRRFPADIQELLRLAACIGSRFDVDTLAMIASRSPAEISRALMVAAQEGYIHPVSEPELVTVEGQEAQLVIREHRFVHDRVQQAAYALVPAARRIATHLDIGRILLAQLPPAKREERLFELVDHLNLGRSLIDTVSGDSLLDSVELARLNLAAGRRAKEAAAYGAAARYFAIGLELVGQAWEEHQDLVLSLHIEGGVAEYCNGAFERSQMLLDAALRHATSAVVKARLYRTLILQYTNQGRYEDAFRAARDALHLLGQSLPATGEAPDALAQEMADIEQILGDRPIESFVDAPEMRDEGYKAAIELLGALAPAAYQTDADMFGFIAARMVRLTLEHGHTVAGVYGYVLHGVTLVAKREDYQRGYQFGDLSLRLAERFHSASAKAKAGQAMFGFLYHWAKPLKGFHPISTESFEAALLSGELQDAAFNLMERLLNYFHEGMSLERVLHESSSYLQFGKNNKNTVVTNTIEAVRIVAAHLRDDRGQHGDIIDMDADAAFIAKCRQESSFLALACYHTLKCQALYVYQEHERALQAAREAQRLRPYMPGIFTGAVLDFYHALCLTALFPHASPEQQQESWQRLEMLQERTQRRMESCPENFRHMYLLVAAEMARITGDVLVALDRYEEAIEAAEKSELCQDVALANELLARFRQARGKTRYALFHMRDAHYNYTSWGARRKLAMLEAQDHQLLVHPWREDAPFSHRGNIESHSVSTMTSTTDELDLASVIKASQVLSSEISLDKLLAKLIEVVIENAGAQHGYLILERKNRLVIEARGTLGEQDVEVLRSLPLEGSEHGQPLVSTAIVNYVLRSRESVVLHEAAQEGPFVTDPYVVAHCPRSILCMPLLSQGKVRGVIYLENNLSPQAFTPERVELLTLLSSQMAISLDNALLYSNLQDANQILERLLHGIAHDLKEPLRAIHSFSELLTFRYGARIDARGRDYLARVIQASEHLGNLLDVIRLLSEIRRTDGPRQQVSGQSLVEKAMTKLQPLIEGTGATIRVAPDLPHVAVEPRWASEAIYQLLHNALRYTHDGQAPEIDIEPYEGLEGVGMVFRDRGSGIPAEYTERVFGLFRRAVGRDVPGTGAGLAIARQIAVKHDGNAWLSARPGGGTEVYIVFGR